MLVSCLLRLNHMFQEPVVVAVGVRHFVCASCFLRCMVMCATALVAVVACCCAAFIFSLFVFSLFVFVGLDLLMELPIGHEPCLHFFVLTHVAVDRALIIILVITRILFIFEHNSQDI